MIMIIISGCGVFSSIGDFTAKQYQNVVCYFNTYYNAKKAYNAGYDAIQTQNTPMTANNYPNLNRLEILTERPLLMDAKSKFELVVEKCSRILNNYTKSSMIDDALYMMGKAYYYNQEYTRAERKFLEIIKQFPESELIPEVKEWSAKCFLKNRKEKDAFSFFDDVIKEGKINEESDLVADIYLTIASYYMTKKDTANALINYQNALNNTTESEVKSQICFRFGEFYEIYDSIGLAADYYLKSANYAVSNVIKFWGKYKYATLQEKFEKYDLAINILNDLKGSKKYEDFVSYSYLALARLNHLKGDDAMAIGLYNYLDTTFKKTDNSVIGYYQLGLIYENIYKEYGKAKECYQRSKEQGINIPASASATERFLIVESYLNIKKSLFQLDSTLDKLHHPDSSIVTLYDTVWSDKSKSDSLKKDSTGVLKDTTGSLSDSSKTGIGKNIDQNLTKSEDLKEKVTNLTKDTIPSPVSKLDSIKKQDNIKEKEKTDSSGIKNKINITALSGKDSLKIAEKQNTKDTTLNKQKNINLQKRAFDSIISRKEKRENPIDTNGIKKAKINIGKKKLEFADLYLNKYENPDSAIYWYNDAFEYLPKDSTIANYYFTMAGAYERIQQKEIADSLYDIIIKDYPTNPIVAEAKLSRGIALDIKTDTALVLYMQADSLLEKDSIPDAIKILENIIKKHPKSVYAEKSQYALGWINENKTNDFKKAIEEYRKLMENYPKSEFAALIKTKMDTVDKYLPVKKKPAATDTLGTNKSKEKTISPEQKLTPGTDIKGENETEKKAMATEPNKTQTEFIRRKPVRNIEDSK
jgi:TolA-binding protein